jgi:protein TIF31
MKLAALQLMQQKASKVENPTSLENGDLPSSESKHEDPLGSEAGNEEGSSTSGLAKVKELAETIASDDSTGGAAVHVGGEPEPALESGLLPGVGHD